MGKQVIVVNSEVSGFNQVYPTLEKASEALGLSASTISRAIAEGGIYKDRLRMRYAERVFGIRLRADGTWRIATEKSRGNGFVLMYEPMNKVSKREVIEVRDITEGWYWRGNLS
jgi:hypothetical protein